MLSKASCEATAGSQLVSYTNKTAPDAAAASRSFTFYQLNYSGKFETELSLSGGLFRFGLSEADHPEGRHKAPLLGLMCYQ